MFLIFKTKPLCYTEENFIRDVFCMAGRKSGKPKQKIRTRILLYFVPVTVLSILAIMISAFSILTTSGLNNGCDNLEKNVKLISRQVDDNLKHIRYNVKAFSTMSMLQEALLHDYTTEPNPALSFLYQMRNSTSTIIDIGNFASSMIVVSHTGMTYDYPGNYVTLDKKNLEAEWYQRTVGKNGVISMGDLEGSGSQAANLVIEKSIIHTESGRRLGAVRLEIRESAFSDIFSYVNSEANGEYFIINSSGTIMSSADKSVLFTSVKDEEYFQSMDLRQAKIYTTNASEEMLVAIAPCEGTDWYVVGMIPKSVIIQQNQPFFQTILLLGLVFILVTSMLAIMLAQYITKPLGDLLRFTQRVSAGNFDAQLPVASRDEIGQLSQSFNHMVGDIKELTYQIWLEQRQKRSYALDFMQAQINPHLLYNSISGINYLIANEQYGEASSALRHLGSYYRKVLKKETVVTVADDIELAADYLIIQQRIHPGLFEFTIDIEPQLLSCPILKLTLQPILENSILHGFMGYERKGQIEIIGCHMENRALIMIFDNGRGFSLNEQAPLRKEEKNHFALRNINDRLKLKFGENCGLKIESIPDAGTLVTIWIPDSR